MPILLLGLTPEMQRSFHNLTHNEEYPIMDLSSVLDYVLDRIVLSADVTVSIDNLMQWLEYDGLCLKSDISAHTLRSLLNDIRSIAYGIHALLKLYRCYDYDPCIYQFHALVSSDTLALRTAGDGTTSVQLSSAAVGEIGNHIGF